MRTEHKSTILLTGCSGNPLNQAIYNPTGLIAKKLDGQVLDGYTIKSFVFPPHSVRHRPALIKDMFDALNPTISLSLGVMAVNEYVLEGYAANHIDTAQAPYDVDGAIVGPLVGETLKGYANKLNLTAIAAALQRKGLQNVRISHNAGTLGCNAIAFGQLHAQRSHPETTVLFVHQPDSEMGIDLNEMENNVNLLLRTLLVENRNMY